MKDRIDEAIEWFTSTNPDKYERTALAALKTLQYLEPFDKASVFTVKHILHLFQSYLTEERCV